MDKRKVHRWKCAFLLLLISAFVVILVVVGNVKSPADYRDPPTPLIPPTLRNASCPLLVAQETIVRLGNTQHLLVSAFLDRRTPGWDVRLIGMFQLDAIATTPLHCFFCCAALLAADGTAAAKVLPHEEHFGFPYVTTDVLCQMPQGCQATHVALSPLGDPAAANLTFLPIRNLEHGGAAPREFQFNLTVCVSSLFGSYNNVLQYAQTLEMYRLLGVQRVVVYNTSSGPDLERLLRLYSEEGLVEVVPWPVGRLLRPSPGWLHAKHGGDVHYYGQMTTLNECTYRYMGRSRYVLLNDIDEIPMPYQHATLTLMMDELQQQQPKAGVFLIENHIFPKHHFEPTGKFRLPQWEGVPGINILEHVYREEPDRKISHPYKMIVQPSMVEQTSVHSVLKWLGDVVKVPPSVCHLIHVRVALQGDLTLDQLKVDTRLWDFHEQLVPRVDAALQKLALLGPRRSRGQA